MRLGLFNWTSDLSDEPEYPPFFDNLKNSSSGATHIRGNEVCIIWLDGGGGFDSTEIGSIEYVANDLQHTQLGRRFGQQFTPEKIPDGVYLVLEHFFMNSWSRAYTDENYWKGYKPHVKEKFEKDSDAWHLATTGFTPEQIRDNFVFSDVEERYVCINPEWNAKAVEIITAQSPTLMRKFNKCIQRIIDHNLI